MIGVDKIGQIRRAYFEQQRPIKEIVRTLSVSRATVRKVIRGQATEFKYERGVQPTPKLGEWVEVLAEILEREAKLPRRERRSTQRLFEELRGRGYDGAHDSVHRFAKAWRDERARVPAQAYVPMSFAPGEAYQFDWSHETITLRGMPLTVKAAHMKLSHSRMPIVRAYFRETQELVFDAHDKAFLFYGGVCRRGIYDNMKTAVDRVGRGKERTVNVRFYAMCSHYLFEPEFCNRAAGWEKGIVEKNVQDRRRQIWREATERRWASLEELNDWLAARCRAAWEEMRHPQWPELTLAELLQDEQMRLMPLPRAFDAYVEQPVRVSATGLIHVQRNRYSVPTEYAHRVVSLRVYPFELVVIAEGEEIARHARSFERDQTFYDWRHYISLIVKKPGALRNGAPFATMPEPLVRLQGCLLKHPGGDRVMAQVLAAVPVHGLEAVLVAAEIALESGRPSGEHVLNVLARLKSPASSPPTPVPATAPALTEEPAADVDRYERLRPDVDAQATHVD